MPGNSEKRPGCVRVTRPPTYVNVPTPVAYAPVPDALVVTMIRVLGLCWTNRYRHTPPLTFEQLARLLDRPRSTLQRHLDILERDLGWLRRELRDRRFVLHPCPPFSARSAPGVSPPAEGADALAEPAGDCGHNGSRCPSESLESAESCCSASGKQSGDGRRPSHDAHRASRDGPRPVSEVLEARQDLIQALAEIGVENPARERIALDPAVKPDWVQAWQLWAEHPHRASLSNLPGYIVSCLKHRERPPEQYLRLVRLTPAERAQLRHSQWTDDRDLDPDLRAIRSLYLQHFEDRNRN